MVFTDDTLVHRTAAVERREVEHAARDRLGQTLLNDQPVVPLLKSPFLTKFVGVNSMRSTTPVFEPDPRAK